MSREPVCVNAHDRCYEGGPCPYCEVPARLIAAAPDLLGAAQGADLSAVDIDADMVTISGASYRALRAAIRKATGEAS
jgi:hypothetical protein